MRVETMKLQKGDVVLLRGTLWPAVVLEATRGKLNREYATALLDVFGWEHEAGSAYVADLLAANNGVQVYDLNNEYDRATIRGAAERQGHTVEQVVAVAERYLARRKTA